ncbi:MAG: cytochrome C oxidase subunit I [Pseudomonadota bacterium]
MTKSNPDSERARQASGRWKLFAVIAVCAAPMIASYLTYYVIKPEGRTNYGTLLSPKDYPIPALGSSALDGSAITLNDFKGKWIMLQVDGADCRDTCKEKLFNMRQLRLTQGKEMGRIERVWLITDNQPLETIVMREYDGTRMLRVRPDLLKAWLPTEPGTIAADHLYIIDPLGNLIMRYPKAADPNKIKKDLKKLLRASSIG